MQVGALVVWELEDSLLHKGHQKWIQWVERGKSKGKKWMKLVGTHASIGSKASGNMWAFLVFFFVKTTVGLL